MTVGLQRGNAKYVRFLKLILLCADLQTNDNGTSKVKQGVQNIKDKLSGHTMAVSGPVAPATGISGGSASTTGHA